eukprot:16336472-Heterocapsa_arctica.AAC.1
MAGAGSWLEGLDEGLLDQCRGRGPGTCFLQGGISGANELLLHAVHHRFVCSTHCTPLGVQGGSRAE